jgi:hypothetical protein
MVSDVYHMGEFEYRGSALPTIDARQVAERRENQYVPVS